jgi:hypothetical protein
VFFFPDASAPTVEREQDNRNGVVPVETEPTLLREMDLGPAATNEGEIYNLMYQRLGSVTVL